MERIGIKEFFDLIFKYFPSKKAPRLTLFLVVLQVICTLYLPVTAMSFIDTLNIKKIDWTKVILVAVIIIFQLVFSAIVLYLMTYNSQHIIMGLRNDLWDKILHLPIRYFDKHEFGEIMSRITNDTLIISEFITNDLLSFISGIISMLGSLILLFIIDWRMAGLMAILIPAAVIVINPLNKKLYEISKEVRNQTAVYQGKLGRVLSNIRLVKASMAENIELESGKNTSKVLFRLGIREGEIMAFIQPITTMIIFCLLIIIFGYGSVRVVNNSMSAGSLVAIVYYLFQIATPCMGLASFFGQLNKNRGAIERINNILNIEEIEKRVDTIQCEQNEENEGLKLNNISFGYESRAGVIKNVTFSVEKNSVVAVVGQSGAGKSTLFSLIERFYTPTKGDIYYDGINIRKIPLKEWRNKIAYVEQNSSIISGTILDNLVYGLDKYNDNVVDQAVADVDLEEFIGTLPDGYNTEVGEQGVKLSGGQRQRIAIARAIIRNPDILLLDEATAHLDSCTEEIVQRALYKLMKGRITIVAAHRFLTIKNANRVIVLKSGEVSGYGTHKELLHSNTLYQELLKLQVNGYDDGNKIGHM